jgi:hypothetical protein
MCLFYAINDLHAAKIYLTNNNYEGGVTRINVKKSVKEIERNMFSYFLSWRTPPFPRVTPVKNL